MDISREPPSAEKRDGPRRVAPKESGNRQGNERLDSSGFSRNFISNGPVEYSTGPFDIRPRPSKNSKRLIFEKDPPRNRPSPLLRENRPRIYLFLAQPDPYPRYRQIRRQGTLRHSPLRPFRGRFRKHEKLSTLCPDTRQQSALSFLSGRNSVRKCRSVCRRFPYSPLSQSQLRREVRFAAKEIVKFPGFIAPSGFYKGYGRTEGHGSKSQAATRESRPQHTERQTLKIAKRQKREAVETTTSLFCSTIRGSESERTAKIFKSYLIPTAKRGLASLPANTSLPLIHILT